MVAYAGYIVVGLGSISFHATLKCKPILAHDMPMNVSFELTWNDRSDATCG